QVLVARQYYRWRRCQHVHVKTKVDCLSRNYYNILPFYVEFLKLTAQYQIPDLVSTSNITGLSVRVQTKNAIVNHTIRSVKGRSRPVPGKTTLVFLHCLLVCQCPDIELNPGPSTSKSQYLCGHCEEEVTWTQKGILCDTCEQWYHTDCQGIGDSTYDRLSDSRFAWHCQYCGQANYSYSLIESLDSLNDSNKYSQLDYSSTILDASHRPDRSVRSLSDTPNFKPSPKDTSTPKTKVKKPSKVKHDKSERITILNINCRSIKNKIPDLHQLIQQVKPDIISCTETWLKPDIQTSEIFPRT
ncbi:uncharacterized protein LOC123559295, partial [Mercenaria mercenaria]|uniref:uncharacterized protein LOC123559295 n=1 Tax=Mercenaria mercenaria TaxID=6596 RepID=UPI00234F91BE